MPFRILSLDGGGAWSLVQASVLADLYGNVNGHELLQQFDQVIANSGGSVFLGLLCSNLNMQEIISFYQNPQQLTKVFPLLPARKRLLDLFFHVGPKYSTADKYRGLQEAIPFDPAKTKKNVLDAYLHEVPDLIGANYQGRKVQLIVPAFDYLRERVGFFRSDNMAGAHRFTSHYTQATFGEIIHASTNAPVMYYDKPAAIRLRLQAKHSSQTEGRSSWFWDGGLAGFNNPVLAGLVEALTNNTHHIGLHEIQVLSLGTGLARKAVIADEATSDNAEVRRLFEINKAKPFVISKYKSGFLTDLRKTAGAILSDPPDSATFIACSFLHPSLQNETMPLVRINPFITPDRTEGIYHYPEAYKNDEESFLKLMELNFDIYTAKELSLLKTMCDRFVVTAAGKPCIQNQLIRGDAAHQYVGHSTYRQARQHWLKLVQKEK